MPLIDYDQETARKFLLGKLTDDQQRDFEQRVLSDDEFADEFEVTKEELVDDYLANQLTDEESEWLKQHFLASPQGKQSREFATTFHRYVSNNPSQPKKRSWVENLVSFLGVRTAPLRAVVALASVLVVVGVLWFAFLSPPRSYATLTLTNSAATRSTGADSSRIKLQADALQLKLLLPEPRPAGTRYSAEVQNERGDKKAVEANSQDGQSVMVEIPSTRLPAGQYAIALYVTGADGSPQRIGGSYQFTVE